MILKVSLPFAYPNFVAETTFFVKLARSFFSNSKQFSVFCEEVD